jgi:hypothetical protein
MKKIKKIVLLLLIVISSNTFAQKKKVAVVTFYANKMVSFEGLGGGFDFILKDVLNLRDDPNFNLSPILEKYHNNFFKDYSKEFPFELLPEQEVLSNPNYIGFTPKYELNKYDAKNYLVYNNYKYVYEGFMGKFNEEGLAKALADKADGVLFVYIDFGLVKGFGIGSTMSIKMRATTRIALYNKTGEKVFAFSEGENSKKTGVMIGGVPIIKPEKLLPMCDSALDELMGDLQKRIAKIVKKSDAKL